MLMSHKGGQDLVCPEVFLVSKVLSLQRESSLSESDMFQLEHLLEMAVVFIYSRSLLCFFAVQQYLIEQASML
jgi:hypothetical protein